MSRNSCVNYFLSPPEVLTNTPQLGAVPSVIQGGPVTTLT